MGGLAIHQQGLGRKGALGLGAFLRARHHHGLLVRPTGAFIHGRSLDPNEEKVKSTSHRPFIKNAPPNPARTQDTTARPPPSQATAPSTAAAAAAAAVSSQLLSPSHVDAMTLTQMVAPIDVGWGEPNDFFADVIYKPGSAPATPAEAVAATDKEGITSSLDALHEAVNSLLTTTNNPSSAKATSTAFKAASTSAHDTLTDLLHDVITAPAAAATSLLAQSKTLSETLFDAIQPGMHLPPAAAQVITYVAAVLGVILLLQSPTLKQQDNNSEDKSGTTGAWDAWAGENDPPEPSGNTKAKRPPPMMRPTTPGMVAAMKSGGGFPATTTAATNVPPPRGDKSPSPAPPDFVPARTNGMNPVQKAWQTFRTNPPVYRAPSEEPPAVRAATRTSTSPTSSSRTTPVGTNTTESASAVKPKTSQALPWLKPGNPATSTNNTPASNSRSQAASLTASTSSSSDEYFRRQALQEKLWLVAQSLGPLLSVIPGGDPIRAQADTMLRELETLAPLVNPLDVQALPYAHAPGSGAVSLLGVWELVYATNDHTPAPVEDPQTTPVDEDSSSSAMGPVTRPKASKPKANTTQSNSFIPSRTDPLPPSTNPWRRTNPADVTPADTPGPKASPPAPPPPRSTPVVAAGSNSADSGSLGTALLHLAALLPGFGVQRVEQKLWTDQTRPDVILVSNSLTFSLGPMGVWQVAASGGWMDTGDGHKAQGWFDNLSLQPVRMFGWDTTTMIPQVVITLPQSLRVVSIWDTTYLDQATRISRGAAGTVFLFHRVDTTNRHAATPGQQTTSGQQATWAGAKLA